MRAEVYSSNLDYEYREPRERVLKNCNSSTAWSEDRKGPFVIS